MNRRKFITNTFKIASLGIILNPLISRNVKAASMRETPNRPSPESWSNNEITMSWIGHSTYLINFYGTIILTDPVFSSRIGIYFLGTNLGPHRLVEPSLNLDSIPKPDLVLLSHAHLDHMDYPTLKSLAKKYPGQINVITAFKTKDVIEELPWKSLNEMDWEEKTSINSIDIRAIESKHFGWRFPWEKDRSKGMIDGRSYNSYILERNDKKILFSCDINFSTLYNSFAKENIDIIMMPVGAYNPWKKTHCNPQEAYTMAERINARYFIPMHTRTFPQGREPYDEAIEWLKRIERKEGPAVAIKEIGETFRLS